MDHVIRGLRPAAKYAQIGVRTLRELTDSGAVPAAKDDGVWVFQIADLDRARELYARTGGATEPAPVPVVAAAIAYPAEPEPREAPLGASWLHAVPAPHPSSGPAFERAEPTPGHEPLGATSQTGPSWLDVAANTHAEVEALRDQLTHAQAAIAQRDRQLVQVTAQARHAQVGCVAQAVAIESLSGAVHAGLIPAEVVQVMCALRDAAAQALAQLSPEQLATPQHAYAIGRQAASVASQQVATQIDRRGRARRDRDQDDREAQRARRERDEQDREHARQLAARSAAVTDRFREQQIAMSRRQANELAALRAEIAQLDKRSN